MDFAPFQGPAEVLQGTVIAKEPGEETRVNRRGERSTWHYMEVTVAFEQNSIQTDVTERVQQSAISSMHPVVAVLFLLLTGLWSGSLIQNYDTATGILNVPLLGTSLVIGEGEESEESEESDDDD